MWRRPRYFRRSRQINITLITRVVIPGAHPRWGARGPPPLRPEKHYIFGVSTVKLRDLGTFLKSVFLSFLLCGRTEEACSMVNSLREVDFSHPTGHYTWKKKSPPPWENPGCAPVWHGHDLSRGTKVFQFFPASSLLCSSSYSMSLFKCMPMYVCIYLLRRYPKLRTWPPRSSLIFNTYQ